VYLPLLVSDIHITFIGVARLVDSKMAAHDNYVLQKNHSYLLNFFLYLLVSVILILSKAENHFFFHLKCSFFRILVKPLSLPQFHMPLHAKFYVQSQTNADAAGN
jgi:hypothetical protein